jgi:alkylated DNA repair protein (DNA oxidative demethylase)
VRTTPLQKTLGLFEGLESALPDRDILGDGAIVLRGFALDCAEPLWHSIQTILTQAPLRHMETPGGLRMSVATSSCGPLGWVSDRRGYRYSATDPRNDQPWPAMPDTLLRLAREAAASAGFAGFAPDACLINRYAPGARLSLHQDRDEHSMGHPIVSVSLGVPAVFLFGGARRADKPRRVPLQHGDVVVWGGPSRLNFHGVLPLAEDEHPLTGPYRVNLTLRTAG